MCIYLFYQHLRFHGIKIHSELAATLLFVQKRTTGQNRNTRKKTHNPPSNTAACATFAPVAILGWSLATQPTDITCILLAWVSNLGLVIWDFNKSGPQCEMKRFMFSTRFGGNQQMLKLVWCPKICTPYLKNTVKHITSSCIHSGSIHIGFWLEDAVCYKSFSYFAHSHCPSTLKWRGGSAYFIRKQSLHTCQPFFPLPERPIFFSSNGAFVISHAASQFPCILPNIWQNFTLSFFPPPLPHYHNLFLAPLSVFKALWLWKFPPAQQYSSTKCRFWRGREQLTPRPPPRERDKDREGESARRNK